MKMRLLVMVFLCLAVFPQTGSADGADDSKKVTSELRNHLMDSKTFAKTKLLNAQSNFIDNETSAKFKAAFPSEDPAGTRFTYTGMSVTGPELEALMKDGMTGSPGALVDHPNEAVAMIYAQSPKKADAFPIIVQVRAEDAQVPGPIKPGSITGITLVYKDGYFADLKKTDPGASPGDAHVGMPVLRLASIPDDSTGMSITDVQGDLVSTVRGARAAVHAKEAPAPDDDEGIPQYTTTKILAAMDKVTVSPADGALFKSFDLVGGQEGQMNMAEITKKGAEVVFNPLLSEQALKNTLEYDVTILAIQGELEIRGPLSLKPVLLDPDKVSNPGASNVFIEGPTGSFVSYNSDYVDRGPGSTSIIRAGKDADRARLADTDDKPTASLAKDADQVVAAKSAEP